MSREWREIERYMPSQLGRGGLLAQSAKGYFEQNELIEGTLTQTFDVGGQPVRFESIGRFRDGKLAEGKKLQGGVMVQESRSDLSKRTVVTSFDNAGRPTKKVYVSRTGEWIKTEILEGGRVTLVREPNVLLGITTFRQYHPKNGRALESGYMLFDREIPSPNIYRLRELPQEPMNESLRDIYGKPVYEGQLVRFTAHGDGRLYNRAGGLLYEGQFEYGMRHGKGTSYGPTDRPKTVPEFVGTFHEDSFHGEGTLYDLSDGTGKYKLYEGTWENGDLVKGCQYKKGVLIYEGEFRNRAPDGHYHRHGKGTCYHDSGTPWFKGEFVYDMFHGTAVEVLNEDGSKYYEGDLEEGLCGKYGVLSMADGTTLEQYSEFQNLEHDIKTEIIHYGENGQVLYKGGADLITDSASEGMEHVTGYKRQREGLINYPNGERFEGHFQNNLRTGEGTHYFADGTVKFRGSFLDDQYNGECEEFLPGGETLFKGFFEQDRCLRGEGTFPFEDEEYTGHIENGCRSGRGEVKYPSGKVKYRGGFQNNLFEGDGEEFDENGVLRYAGGFSGGLYNGYGLQYAPYGDLQYEGHWNQGKRTGEGKLYAPDGCYYEGGFENDLKSGFGLDFYADGRLRYEGHFLAGKESGEGKLYDPDGKLMYDGQWSQGDFYGEGKSYYANGNLHFAGQFAHGLLDGMGSEYDESGLLRFEGIWKNGQRAGEGRVYYKNKESFEGAIINGLKQGFGRYYYANGLLAYEGDYLDNRRHGTGTAYDLEGRIHYRGEWKYGQKDGTGAQYGPDGVLVYEGGYKEGKFHGAGKYYSGENILYYEGDFAYGRREGYGLHYNKNGIRDYAGYYEEGMRSGFGISYTADGEHVMYSGFWSGGKYHGCGVIYLHDQPRFSGMFLDGEMNGRVNEIDDGRIIREAIYENGETIYQRTYDQADTLIYEGEACGAGIPHGDGISYDGLGNVTFKGRFDHGHPVSLGRFVRKTVEPMPKIPELGSHDFNLYRTKRVYKILGVELEKGMRLFCTLEDGIPSGVGSAVFHDGRKYFGPFKDGRPTGQGTILAANGRKFTGEVFDGLPHGYGVLTLPDGSRYEGEFRSMLRNSNLKVMCTNGDVVHAQFRDDVQVSHAIQYKFVTQSLSRFPDGLSGHFPPAQPAAAPLTPPVQPVYESAAEPLYYEAAPAPQDVPAQGFTVDVNRVEAGYAAMQPPAPPAPPVQPAAPAFGAVQQAGDPLQGYTVEFDRLLVTAQAEQQTAPQPEAQNPDGQDDAVRAAQDMMKTWMEAQ